MGLLIVRDFRGNPHAFYRMPGFVYVDEYGFVRHGITFLVIDIALRRIPWKNRSSLAGPAHSQRIPQPRCRPEQAGCSEH
jgi:hypothetical protein